MNNTAAKTKLAAGEQLCYVYAELSIRLSVSLCVKLSQLISMKLCVFVDTAEVID